MVMSRSSFEAAVARYQRRVFTLARYLMSDPSEAEDITQEVLVRLWNNPEMIDSECLGAWLLKVTRNACYDRLRIAKSRARFLSSATDKPGDLNVSNGEPDPETLAQAAQFNRQLKAALAELDEPFRSVVVLREIQDLSYREISEVLDITLGTVKVTLHRGRRKLREKMRKVMRHAAAC